MVQQIRSFTTKSCKTCYWKDFVDDDEPDNDPCRNCAYDPGHYNYKSKAEAEAREQLIGAFGDFK
jgi:hypothetical protein